MEGRADPMVPGARIKRDGKEIREIDNILVSFVNKYQERYNFFEFLKRFRWISMASLHKKVLYSCQ